MYDNIESENEYLKYSKNYGHGFLYIAVTILWTWSVLFIPVFLKLDFESAVTKTAYLLAGASPSVIAIIFVFRSKDNDYIKSFFSRIIRFDLISLKGYIFLLLFIPAITISSEYISYFITSHQPNWSILVSYLKSPVNFFTFILFTLFFGPLVEEIGWRGHLFDCFKNKGILIYGLVIGVIWTIWHLPMFFISGTYQNSLLGQGIIPVLCFAVSTTAFGIIIGEFTYRNKFSILSAILFHFIINFIGEIIPLDITGTLIKTTFLSVASLFLLLRKSFK